MNIVWNSRGNLDIYKTLCGLDLGILDAVYVSLATLLARLHTPPSQPSESSDSELPTSSNSSTESKLESYARDYTTNFLEATHRTVTEWMQELA